MDMVEKVAKAVFDKHYHQPFLTDDANNREWLRIKNLLIGDARAAIEAMREPTPEMKANGVQALIDIGLDSVDGVGPYDSECCWDAMIDAALK